MKLVMHVLQFNYNRTFCRRVYQFFFTPLAKSTKLIVNFRLYIELVLYLKKTTTYFQLLLFILSQHIDEKEMVLMLESSYSVPLQMVLFIYLFLYKCARFRENVCCCHFFFIAEAHSTIFDVLRL